jgi:hypothetical protein
MLLRSFFLAILATMLLSNPALALPTIFTDRQLFNAAVGPQDLLTFEEFAPPNIVCVPRTPFIPDPCTLTLKGATFTSARGIPDLNVRPELAFFTEPRGSTGLIPGNFPITPNDFFLTFSGHFIGLDVVTPFRW